METKTVDRRAPSIVALALLALALASVVGCSSTVSPVVRSVKQGKSGLIVESCDLTANPAVFGGATLSLDNCKTQVVSP
jgi:hypothetical protein